jgi:hypothetical protein
MTAGYSAGSVWWGRLDFRDGRERKKYFVLLNDISDENDLFIAAFTTSRATRYHGQTGPCGCPDLPCYRIDAGQEKCFEFTTWIQYDNTILLTRAKLENVRKNGTGGFLQLLATDRIRAVMNCALKSIDLPGDDIERITKTLKAMKTKSAPAQPAKSPIPPSPIDVLWVDFERHDGDCRQKFYGLVQLSETEVTEIFSKSKTAPANFVEEATVAMELIRESCGCRAAGKKS